MVNRFKKRLWFLLVVFLVYLISPGYPDSKKKKTIHNLPVNQDMGAKSWRYSAGDDKVKLEAMEEKDCQSCWGTLDDAIRCRYCVELKGGCKDCCFSGENPDSGIIRCTEADDDDYKCKSELFDRDDCEPVVCDTDKCNTECTNYEYVADSPCKEVLETGGKVNSAATESRWQRKGCPEEESEDLAPDNDDCTLVEDTKGKGLDRKWKCEVTEIKPTFANEYVDEELCAPNSGLSFTYKPDSSWEYGDYYAVTEVSPRCPADTCTNTCKSECKITVSSPSCCVLDSCGAGADSCTPASCTPECPDKKCNYNCVSGTACVTADESTDDCVCVASGPCNPSSCAPECSSGDACAKKVKSCEGGACESECSPASETYYVYVLSDKYKKYIKECIDYADKYDACMDRVNCCKKGVCQDTSVKNKKTGEYDCVPGASDNCPDDDCEKRRCYHDDIDRCDEFTSIDAKKSCPGLASDVHGCLIDEKNAGCFKEIKTGDDDEPFHYSYVASSNDALNIIWQITSTSSDKDVKGLNFYTLVKVFELDANGNPEGDPVHTSMANVKSQEAAFSIYGTTNAAKGLLKEGVSYGVYLYYSLPPGEFCVVSCECPEGDEDCKAQACKNDTTIELTYVSLILQRVRE